LFNLLILSCDGGDNPENSLTGAASLYNPHISRDSTI
jgi:hypothetical protein